MGNVDSRSKNDKGYIMLQTTKPFYYPGEFCQGTIYMRTEVPLDVTEVHLKVKGKEKVSFMGVEYETVREGGEERVEARDVKRKNDDEFIKFGAPCFNFDTDELAPGDYAFPFSFQIPQGLPSSILYTNKHHDKKPKAKVKYTVKVLLKGKESDHMKYK